MDTESRQISPEESLHLITTMIRLAQGKMQRNAFYFLLWGWIIIVCNVGMYLLMHFSYPYPWVIWAITIPAWIFTIVKASKKTSGDGTVTHMDRISMWLWIMFGVIIFTLMSFGSKINYQLGPVILLVGALPTFVSGIMIRFRPLIAGGLVFWVSGIVSFLVSPEFQPLVGAAAIICGYLIPGYMLKNSKE